MFIIRSLWEQRVDLINEDNSRLVTPSDSKQRPHHLLTLTDLQTNNIPFYKAQIYMKQKIVIGWGYHNMYFRLLPTLTFSKQAFVHSWRKTDGSNHEPNRIICIRFMANTGRERERRVRQEFDLYIYISAQYYKRKDGPS